MQRTLVAATLALAVMLALPTPAQAQAAADNPRCSANPVFARFAGETLSTCERVRLADLKLMRWNDASNPRAGVTHFSVEGEYWYYHGPVARDEQGRAAGKLQVRRHFENAVKQAGGTVLYVDEGGGRVSFTVPTPGGDYWGESGCGGGGGTDCTAIHQKIVRVAAVQPAAPGPGNLTHGPVGGGPGGNNACNCACACQDGSAGGTRPGFAPGLWGHAQRPLQGQIDTSVPAEPTAYPPRGMRGMLVHIAGRGVGEATAVYFGDTPARMLGTVGDRISVTVPGVPTEAMVVSLQMPAGRVAVREPFQVYQLPDQSQGTVETPCTFTWGRVDARITALAPQRVLPGALLTVTAPGVGALKTRIDAENRAHSGPFPNLSYLGLAFSHDPSAFVPAGNDFFDNIARADAQQTPMSEATLTSPDTVTVRVPPRAVTGPLAVVVYASSLGGRRVQECLASGPGLSVAPPSALPPPRR
jgi:hypothetical protein